MTRWQILAIALVAAAMTASDSNAQPANSRLAPAPPPAQNPNYRYAVTPQAGDWFICVQTFKGTQAQSLAEQMAEMMMRDYKLPAYLYSRSCQERAEEDEQVRQLRKKYDETVRELMTVNPDTKVDQRFRVKRYFAIDDEFVVLINDSKRFKDMDAAHDFLPKLRKMPAPPKEFSSRVEFADVDPTGKKMNSKGNGYLNPFTTAWVVHNPTIPLEKQQSNPEVADELLKKLNANESLSVLKCSKPYTLVVRVFQGPAFLKPPEAPSVIYKVGEALGVVEKDPETLNAQALKARELADFLRKMKPSFESYVMHQPRYSIVTVGQYDSPTDPNLVANRRSLAAFQIKDAKTGAVLEQLSVQPLPMKIPR